MRSSNRGRGRSRARASRARALRPGPEGGGRGPSRARTPSRKSPANRAVVSELSLRTVRRPSDAARASGTKAGTSYQTSDLFAAFEDERVELAVERPERLPRGREVLADRCGRI